MRKIFMIIPIMLIILITASCVKNTSVPTGTALPSMTAVPSATFTSQPTVTETSQPPAGIGQGTTACPVSGLPNPDWQVYCDEANGFYIQYPPLSSLSETDAGITHIDLPVQPGTNLGEKYVEITIRLNEETCSSPLAEGYVPEAVNTEQLVINGLNFVKQSGSDAGAGNYYNWIAYSTGHAGMCVSFGFVLHSTNRYNYPTPPPEFDMEAETAVLGQMMDTFRWVEP
jgi:hypothetical protein